LVSDFGDLRDRLKIPSKKRTISQINTVLRLFMWLCIGISGVLITVCAAAYIANSAVFDVKRIEINGIAHVKADEVLTLLDIEEGDNILSWDMNEARRRLQGHPWIRDLSISRNFVPASIEVSVSEHAPAATLFLKDRPYLISEQGQVFVSSPEKYYGLMIDARQYDRRDMQQGLGQVLMSAVASARLARSKGLQVQDVLIEPGGLVDIRLKNGITLTIFGGMTPVMAERAIRVIQKLNPPEGTVMDLRCDDKVVLRNGSVHGSEG
jgi:cell division septal protein FtsQ